MAEMDECIKSDGKGALMEIYAIPSAESTRIMGIDPWRKRINIRVGAPPKNSEANREILRYIAGLFGIGMSEVRIRSGEKSRKKSVFIPIDRKKAIEILKNEMRKP